MGLTLSASPKSLLALDIETTPRWWWYDGKATNRVMMFVGQWIARADEVQMPPFGWILVPEVIYSGLKKSFAWKYEGLPLIERKAGLHRIAWTIRDADVLVGHNLTGFDVGMINGELKLVNFPLLDKKPIIDTLTGATKVKGQSMALANRLSRLPDAGEKPHVNPVVWEAAFHDFDPDALREVWGRATADVRGHIDLFVNDYGKGYLR